MRTKLDEKGRELLDSKPMQPPVGYKRQPSLAEQIREQVRLAKLELQYEVAETEDEADDFDIPDDPIEPNSPWENDTIPTLKSVQERYQRLEAELRSQGFMVDENGDLQALQAQQMRSPAHGNEPAANPHGKAGSHGTSEG